MSTSEPTPEQIEDASHIYNECSIRLSGAATHVVAQFLAARDAANDAQIAELRKEIGMMVAAWHEMWYAASNLAKKINFEPGIPGVKVVEAKAELDEVFRVALRQQAELEAPVGEREHIGWMKRAEKAEAELADLKAQMNGGKE